MSTSIDSLIVNDLEKAVSSDQVAQTTIVGRSLAEVLRGLAARHGFLGFPAGGADETTETQHRTLERAHGFAIANLNATTRTLTIGPGVLLADTGSEVPTSLDSTFRVGLLLVDTDVVFDVPASDLFWNVIEIQVQNVGENETRSVLINPVTDTFQDQSVLKRSLKRVALRARVGFSDDLPAPETGWIPIYAFKVPLVTSNLVLSDVVDLRYAPGVPTMPAVINPLDTDNSSTTHYATARQLTTQPGPGFDLRFNLAAVVGGVPCQLYTARESVVDASIFLERGVGAIDQDSWYYLYLARCPYNAPNNPHAGNLYGWRGVAVNGNCLLVVTTKVPRVNGTNQAPLLLGDPFNSFDVAAGDAVAVAAVRTPGAAPTQWLTTRISADGVASMEALVRQFTLTGAGAADFTTLTVAGASPAGIGRTWRGQIGSDVVANGPSNTELLFANPGFTGALGPTASGEVVTWNPRIRDDYRSFEAPSRNLAATPGFDTPGDEIVGLTIRSAVGAVPPALSITFSDVMGTNIVNNQIHVRVTGFTL